MVQNQHQIEQHGQRTTKTHLVPASDSRFMPNIQISLPSVVVEAIAASTKMGGIAWAWNIAVCFIPNNTIGACDIGDITTDYIARVSKY